MVVIYFEGMGVYLVMKNVLKKVKVLVEDIDVVSVYVISIKVGDFFEILVIKKLFGEFVYDILVMVNKLMFGYMFGVVGGVEVIVLIESLRYGIILLMINL